MRLCPTAATQLLLRLLEIGVTTHQNVPARQINIMYARCAALKRQSNASILSGAGKYRPTKPKSYQVRARCIIPAGLCVEVREELCTLPTLELALAKARRICARDFARLQLQSSFIGRVRIVHNHVKFTRLEEPLPWK